MDFDGTRSKAFESRILTDTVINSNYIELRFLEDAGNVMLANVRHCRNMVV